MDEEIEEEPQSGLMKALSAYLELITFERKEKDD